MKSLLSTALLLLLWTSAALAQVHPHISDFIPSGWEIEYSLKSDLTGDGVPDVVMILVEHIPDSGYRDRKLIVLKRRELGYELIGRNDNALWSANVDSEVVAIRKGDSDGINLRAKDGKLILSEGASFGAHNDVDAFTFRYDKRYNRMREIGADGSYFFRPEGNDDISKNYLTGQCTEVKSIVDKDYQDTGRLAKTHHRISKKVIWMEDAVSAEE